MGACGDTSSAAVILAAGRSRRLGTDKALVGLPDGRGGEEPAIARLARWCRQAGCDPVIAVRRADAAPLPDGLLDDVVAVDTAEMIHSVRAGLDSIPRVDRVLIIPIDHAGVAADTVAAVLAATADAAGAARIALPICRGRPGHPIAVTWSVVEEILAPNQGTLRDVLRADPSRVVGVPVEDPFSRRDIDTPAELRAVRGALAAPVAVTEQMVRHRSRRRFLPVEEADVADSQLRWLVDAARHAATSSFVQAYSVVAVRDPERKRRCAELCGDQPHIAAAPVFLAICADLAKVDAACRRHGGELGDDWLEVFVEATVDAALVGQNLQLAAESEGLGSCMIGGARNRPVELAALLELPPHVYVVFGMTLGWPADDPVPRGRMTLDAVLHAERYPHDRFDAWLDDADDRMRDWARESNRRAPDAKPIDEGRGWSDRMWWLLGRGLPPKGRAGLRDALRRLGFGLESRRDDRGA